MLTEIAGNTLIKKVQGNDKVEFYNFYVNIVNSLD